MKRGLGKALLTILLFSAAHFLVTFLFVVPVGFAYAAMRMDDNDPRERHRMGREVEPVTAFERFITGAGVVLATPSVLIASLFPEPVYTTFSQPTFWQRLWLEYLPLSLGSLVWGAALFAVYQLARKLKRGKLKSGVGEDSAA